MVPTAFLGGMPGGMELAVIFLIFVSLAIPVLLVLALFRFRRAGSGNDLEDRVANLEGQVAALREEVRESTDE
jgi:membrane protein implicated in regulation of membrane protease activity